MLTKPDFLKKQILFIDSDKNKKIKFKNQNLILVDENKKIILQHSCYRIFMVFVYGECSITSVMIKNALKHSIPIVLLNYNLKTYFSIIPKDNGNFLLRKKQYAYEKNLEIAKHIIKNKITNQRNLISQLRYKSKLESNSIKKIDKFLEGIDNVIDSEQLLGIEGSASKEFFSVYFRNLDFKGRKPRCRSDIFNLLLDIGYHYLFNFIEANLVLYGFDTYCGFYHKFYFQRKSLVCDIVEPFRCIIDKRIRKSYSLKQINENDFYISNGQYSIKRDLNKKYSKIFLKEILKNKEEIFLYIQSYYRSFMKSKEPNEFPFFSISDSK